MLEVIDRDGLYWGYIQGRLDDKPQPNIVLDYPIRIERQDGPESSEVLFADRAEVFLDEHDIQWVKFVANNGYGKGKEHMIRTDSVGFTIVRDEPK